MNIIEFGRNDNILYLIRLCLFILAAMLSFENFNVAIMLSFIAVALYNGNLTFLDYICLLVILVLKSQTDIVLASGDLNSYLSFYNEFALGGEVTAFGKGEFLLLSLFDACAQFTGTISREAMAFSFVLAIFCLSIPIINRLKQPIIIVFFILFIDVNLVVHLFRQMFASLLILNAMFISNKKTLENNILSFFLIICAVFIHTTSIIFIPLMLFIRRIEVKTLIVFFAFAFPIGFIAVPYINEFLITFLSEYGRYPILSKAAFSLTVKDGESGVRAIAYISMICVFICYFADIKKYNDIMSYIVLFFTMSLLLHSFPIISTRIGLVATSLLTGIPIGISVYLIRSMVVNKINYGGAHA